MRLLKMKEVTCSPAPQGIGIAPFMENSLSAAKYLRGQGESFPAQLNDFEGKGESWHKGIMLTCPGPGST